MIGVRENSTEFSAVIRQLDERLRAGQVTMHLKSSEKQIFENLVKLQDAEQISPETLKLTVTL